MPFLEIVFNSSRMKGLQISGSDTDYKYLYCTVWSYSWKKGGAAIWHTVRH